MRHELYYHKLKDGAFYSNLDKKTIKAHLKDMSGSRKALKRILRIKTREAELIKMLSI